MAYCSKNKIIYFIQFHQDVTTFIIFVHSELVSILYFNHYSRISDVYGRNTRQDGDVLVRYDIAATVRLPHGGCRQSSNILGRDIWNDKMSAQV